MSALGNYIHLYYSNYKKYGTAKKGQEPSFGNYTINIINRRIDSAASDIDYTAVKQLEKRLKLNSQSQLEKSQKELIQKQQKMIDQIYTLLFERSKQVSGVEKLFNISQGDYWKTVNNTSMHILSGSSFWASSKNINELKSLREKAKILYKEIFSLINKINNQPSQQSQDNLEKLEKLYKEYTHLSYDSNDHTVGAIEKAINEKLYDGTASNIAGKFGEMFVATCDDKIFKQANKSVAEIVESAVKGDQRTEILIDKSLFADNRGDYIFNTSSKDGTKYSLGSTQNKVDVQITINDENILASVKSYSSTDSKKARPDLQEVNLLTTLAFLNDYQNLNNIGNHWLNIHSSHPGVAMHTDQNLDEIIKKEIAFQALSSGNPFKQNVKKANVFIFINRGTGQVFVKSIKDILFNQFQTIGGLNNISRMIFQNHKSNQIEDRITNILNQVHQQNLQVALNIKFD